MFKKISEFTVGQDIQGFYLVKQANLRTTVAGKRYLDATLVDTTGEINAKYWDAEEVAFDIIQEGKIVKISAKVNEWQNQRQLSIKKYRPVSANDEVKIENFVPSAPKSGEFYIDYITSVVTGMQNKDIKALCLDIIDLRRDALLVYPAAKSFHHAIRSGLAYHIYRMLLVAEKLCQVYPNVNSDLLFAGVILHDICKIDEMELNSAGLVSEYSIRGNLLGHITMGVQLVGERGKLLNLDAEVIMLLEHMILAHHYEAEYGSPKKPLFLEAELLHHIDIIDAAVYDFDKAVKSIEEGNFSDPVFSLERRRIYKPQL